MIFISFFLNFIQRKKVVILVKSSLWKSSKNSQRFLFSSHCSLYLAYAFNYQHLFNAIRLTYLKGETSATIDDGVDFPSRNINKGTPQPWQKIVFTTKPVYRKNVVENLKTPILSFWSSKTENYCTKNILVNTMPKVKPIFSMAKAFTVMLMGAAKDKLIKSENELYSDFFLSLKMTN